MSPTPGWDRPLSPVLTAAGWADPTEEKVTSVTLGTLTLATGQRERVRAAAAGYALTFISQSGWYGGARDTTETISHWSGDGLVAMLPRLGARAIVLSGQIWGRTAGDAVEGMDALDGFRSGVLRIADAGRAGPREADVRRVSQIDFSRITPEVIDWSVSLSADDPLRFGSSAMRLTNGSVAVPNRGNAVLSPVLDLVGPHGALTITHPGGTYTFAALAAGQRRTLDWRNGDVWSGNARVFGVEGGRRPAVLAGGSTWTVAGLGTGTATLRRYEAWT